MKNYIIISFVLGIFLVIYSFTFLSTNENNKAAIQSAKSNPAPEIKVEKWINADKDITLESLRGKVVLIEFWTYGCYNCKNTIPYINAWYEKYKSQGLEIIGIHCPEFSRERNYENVKNSVEELEIKYPVAVDNEFYNWYRYNVHAWPTLFLIDKKGEIKLEKVGEGGYKKTEDLIITLLAENP